jgi:putative ABC transport system substrate-binding protein
MNRKTVWVLIFFTLASVHPAGAQQPRKIPRIGFLGAASASFSTVPGRREAFRQGLRDLGYVEGKNIVIEYRYAEEKPNRLAVLAMELVRLKVDVIIGGAKNYAQ